MVLCKWILWAWRRFNFRLLHHPANTEHHGRDPNDDTITSYTSLNRGGCVLFIRFSWIFEIYFGAGPSCSGRVRAERPTWGERTPERGRCAQRALFRIALSECPHDPHTPEEHDAQRDHATGLKSDHLRDGTVTFCVFGFFGVFCDAPKPSRFIFLFFNVEGLWQQRWNI